MKGGKGRKEERKTLEILHAAIVIQAIRIFFTYIFIIQLIWENKFLVKMAENLVNCTQYLIKELSPKYFG